MKKIAIIIFLVFSVLKMNSQDATQQLGFWYTFGGSHKLSEKYHLKSAVEARFFDMGDDLQQFFFRVVGSYKINNNYSFGLGYVYLNNDKTFKIEGGTINEHRIYEEFIAKHRANKLRFTHRFVVEHRFFYTKISHWGRYRFTLSHPISKRWSAYMFDEIFLNFQGNTFAQNWLNTGVKYKLSNTTKLKFGYQKIVNSVADFDRLQIGIYINTN